jgi:hypothetical protein
MGDSEVVIADFGGVTPEEVLYRLLHNDNDVVRYDLVPDHF